MFNNHTEFKLMPADILFTHGGSWVSKSIRWMTRSAGESRTYANHVAIVATNDTVVEALNRVVQIPLSEWMRNHDQYRIYRSTALTDISRLKIATWAELDIGRKYGYLKIGAHAIDGLIQKAIGGQVYLFRRMCCMNRYPICSWVSGWAYWRIGIQLGAPPAFADPDTQEDFCRSNPEWSLVSDVGGNNNEFA